MPRIDLNGYLIIINKGGGIMKVYIVIEIYFSEDGVRKEIKCVCKDKNTARNKMKEYADKQIEQQYDYENYKFLGDKYILYKHNLFHLLLAGMRTCL